MPPMNIRVRDHRQFGRKPTVGIHVLKSLEEFRCDPVQAELAEDDDGVQGKLPYIDQPCPCQLPIFVFNSPSRRRM